MKTKIDSITQSYLECALWASSDENGNPLDGIDAEVSQSAIESSQRDLLDFMSMLDDLGIDWQSEMSDAQFAHDFFLTRNGHGAGFWDRGLGELGDDLTKWAKTYGPHDFYLGDDGAIYAH